MASNRAENSLRLLRLGSHSIRCIRKSELKTNLFSRLRQPINRSLIVGICGDAMRPQGDV